MVRQLFIEGGNALGGQARRGLVRYRLVATNRHNDPARFWRHGVAALDRARPGLAGRVGPLFGPPAPSSYQGLVTALINALAAGPGEDLDYLAAEVLARQPVRVREFLLETSVLERLSGQLCDAVTGRPGSQALLEQAERAGLFVVPLDEVRGWWRYHHLFADLLRARLQAELPGRVPDCTVTRPPGTRSAGWPMTRSGTRSPPGRWPGPPG